MMRRVQTFTGNGVTVTFDPNLCRHTAECLNALPAVFDVGRKRWIRPEAAPPEEVEAAVAQCPSGALRFIAGAGKRAEPAADAAAGVSLRISRNGPILVEGSLDLLDENEAPLRYGGRCALCRCGATTNPPFCDGAHGRTGWKPKTHGGSR